MVVVSVEEGEQKTNGLLFFFFFFFCGKKMAQLELSALTRSSHVSPFASIPIPSCVIIGCCTSLYIST